MPALHPRPHKDDRAQEMINMGANAGMSDLDKWACMACTFLNFLTSRKCTMCNTPAPEGVVKLAPMARHESEIAPAAPPHRPKPGPPPKHVPSDSHAEENESGNKFFRMGEFEAAFRAYEHAHKLYPEHPLYLVNQSVARFRQRKWQEAITLSQRVLGMLDKPPPASAGSDVVEMTPARRRAWRFKALLRIARSHEGAGDITKALPAFEEAMRAMKAVESALTEAQRAELVRLDRRVTLLHSLFAVDVRLECDEAKYRGPVSKKYGDKMGPRLDGVREEAKYGDDGHNTINNYR